MWRKSNAWHAYMTKTLSPNRASIFLVSIVRLRSFGCNFKCSWNYIKSTWSSFWENQSRNKSAAWNLRRDVTRCIVTWTIPIRSAASTTLWGDRRTHGKGIGEPSYQNQILFYEKKAQESWMATLSAETQQLNKLIKENDHFRQILPNVPFKPKPF